MQRLLALVLLLVAGMLSLPVAAAFLDGEGTENWILPVQLGVMAALGALCSVAVPGFPGHDAAGARRPLVGAAIGVGMALLGVAVFWLLLNGFSGA